MGQGSNFACVVTTIQPPTPSMVRLAEAVAQHDGRLIVIGDRKGPASYDLAPCTFLSLDAQADLSYASVACSVENSYARKNLGYLIALASGATSIYETDDDTAPTRAWRPRARITHARQATSLGWFNVFGLFSDDGAWPRGYPLEKITAPAAPVPKESTDTAASIQASLIDGEPDVDAIWRLTHGTTITYRDDPSVRLAEGVWCPFNSQATWWWPPAFPLMYLPMYCSFRMTDIWRSFVAQRCLWAMGEGVVHHASDVLQVRNPHSLLQDFEQEVPGYLGNQSIVDLLAAVDLSSDPTSAADNCVICYDALVDGGFIGAPERESVRAWRDDVTTLMSGHIA